MGEPAADDRANTRALTNDTTLVHRNVAPRHVIQLGFLPAVVATWTPRAVGTGVAPQRLRATIIAGEKTPENR